MKLSYCASCGHVGMKARYERDRCERCRGATHTIRVPYPWQYAAGVLVILAGAVFLILPQVAAGVPWSGLTDGLGLRLLWLAVILVVGFYFSNWGVRVMKARALERGRRLHAEGDA